MRVLLAPYLLVLIKALTIPVSNSITAASITDSSSQSPDCSVFDPVAHNNVSANASNVAFQDTGQDDPGNRFDFTGSLLSLNAGLDISDLNDKWHGEFIYVGKRICATAVFVDAAHALAKMALDDLLAEETFTVSNYDEVQIRIIQFEAEFTRHYAAFGTYAAIQKMDKDNRFEASRFTFFKGKVKMGTIEFIGRSCSSGSCGANSRKTSLPLVVPLNESPPATNHMGPPQSAVTKLVNATNDDDPDMELDCEWHGRKIHPRAAMLTPSSLLTYSHIVREDPMGHPPIKDVVDDEALGLSTILLATPQPSPTAPLWSYYWAIRAIGKMPEKMADRWDWREMTMTVNVDGYQLGTISLVKALVGSSSSLPGANNGSTLVT